MDQTRVSAPGLILKSLFTHYDALDRHINAPMLEEREAFLHHLLELGRTRRIVIDVAATVCHVVRLTQASDRKAVNEADISIATRKWIEEVPQTRNSHTSSGENFKATARSWFRFLGVYAPPRKSDHLFESQFTEFMDCMRQSYLPSTLQSLTYSTRGFLVWVSRRQNDLAAISLDDVDDYLGEKRIQGWKPRTAIALCRALRTFFGYAETRGWNEKRLSQAIKSPPAGLSRLDLPNGPSWRQVRSRIACLDDSKPSHCRARAVLLLASVYGLRTCEIARLSLDDLDWYNEVMTVRRAKRGRLQQFPIQFEVGEAIIRYLRTVRPACRHRSVFITLQTPYRPVDNLGPSIRRFLNAPGIFEPPCGLHALRHACATELLRKGTSLRGIADFLGHRSIRSVSIYARSDVRALRKVADINLKGVL